MPHSLKIEDLHRFLIYFLDKDHKLRLNKYQKGGFSGNFRSFKASYIPFLGMHTAVLPVDLKSREEGTKSNLPLRRYVECFDVVDRSIKGYLYTNTTDFCSYH